MTLPMQPGYEPRPWQLEAVAAARAMLQKHRSIIISAATGCHARDELIMRFSGEPVKAQDVEVGDRLMGPDSRPRTVLSLTRGNDEMFRILPIKGEPFVVNGDHILSLVDTRDTDAIGMVDVSVRDWMKWCNHWKHLYKLVRVSVQYPPRLDNYRPVPPWHLGVLIGDGCLSTGTIRLVSGDDEIINAFHEWAQSLGLQVRTVQKDGCVQLAFVGERGVDNPIMRSIYKLGLNVVGYERRIPSSYLYGPADVRADMLAGLMDSDGHMTSGGFDFIAKSRDLAADVTQLSRSLGLAAYLKSSVKHSQYGGGTYWRVSISGDISIVPCRLPRKQASTRKQIKSVLRTGFRVEPVGKGDYYGFTVDKDHRYLMADFTVTHNCGKGDLIAGLAVMAARKGNRVLTLAERNNLVHEIPDRIRLIPGAPSCGVVRGEANQWLNPIVSASVQTLRMPSRLPAIERFRPSLVLTDEAHHACAPGYLEIYEKIDSVSTGWRHIGLSATPFRTGPNGTTLGLGKVFDAVAYEYPIQDAIAAGDLVPIRAFRVDSKVSLDAVRVGDDGDYDESDLAKVVDCDERNDLIVDEYEKLLLGQPAAVFAVNIAHAEHIAARFVARGHKAIAVSGQTKGADRILRDFDAGRFPVISSCDLIREGWNSRRVVGILKGRPTKSLLVFMQMLGRGTRTSPATKKTECIFVDFVDNGCTFDLETFANLSQDEAIARTVELKVGDLVQRRHFLEWGTGVVLDLREVGPVLEYQVGWPMTKDNPDGLRCWHPRKELRRADPVGETDKPEPLQPKVVQAHRYEIQLFGRVERGAPPPVGWYEYDGTLIATGTLGTPLRRYEAPRGWRTYSTEVKVYLRSRPTGWEVWSLTRTPKEVALDAEGFEGVTEIRFDEAVTRERWDLYDRGTAVLWAQEYLRSHGVRVTDHSTQWRGEAITEKQAKALRSWGIRRDLAEMSRGEASILFEAVVARRKVAEAEKRAPRRPAPQQAQEVGHG